MQLQWFGFISYLIISLPRQMAQSLRIYVAHISALTLIIPGQYYKRNHFGRICAQVGNMDCNWRQYMAIGWLEWHSALENCKRASPKIPLNGIAIFSIVWYMNWRICARIHHWARTIQQNPLSKYLLKAKETFSKQRVDFDESFQLASLSHAARISCFRLASALLCTGKAL